MWSAPRVLSVDAGRIVSEASYAVFRTKPNQLTTVYNVGRYEDVIRRTPDGLKFESRLCIFDSELIPNSSSIRSDQEPERMSTEWTRALARADVPDEDVIAVTAGGREIALYGVDGEVYATDNLCTHGNARLCDGFHGPRDRMPAAPGPLRRARRARAVFAAEGKPGHLPRPDRGRDRVRGLVG